MRKERENMDRLFKERMKRTMGTFGSGGEYASYSSYSSPSSSFSSYSISSNVGGGGDNFTSFTSLYNRNNKDDKDRKSDIKSESPYSRIFKDDPKFGKDDSDEKLTPDYGSTYVDRAKSTSPSFGRYTSGLYSTDTTSDSSGTSYRSKYASADADEPISGLGNRSYLFTSNLSSPTISVDLDDSENTRDPLNMSEESKLPFSSFRQYLSRSKSSTTASNDEEDRRSPTKPFSSYIYSRLSQSSPASPRHSFSTTGSYSPKPGRKTETSTEDLIAQIKKERGEEASENIDTKLDEKYEDLIAKIKHERGELEDKTEKLKIDDSTNKDTKFSASNFSSSPLTGRKNSYTFSSYNGNDILSPSGSDPASKYNSVPNSTENLFSTTTSSFRKRYDLDDELDSFPTRDYSSLPRKSKDASSTPDGENSSPSFMSSSLPRRNTTSERMKEQMEWERKFVEDCERRKKAREEEQRLNEEKIQLNLLKQQQDMYNERRSKRQWEERFANFPKIYREEMDEAKRQYASRHPSASRDTTSPSYSFFSTKPDTADSNETEHRGTSPFSDVTSKQDITA